MSISHLYLRSQPRCSFLQEACPSQPWWKASLLSWAPKVWNFPFRTFHFLHFMLICVLAPQWVLWVPTSSDWSAIILPQYKALFNMLLLLILFSHFSHVQLFLRLHGLMEPARLLCPWDFQGKNTGVGIHSLLQGIFPAQGSNLGLLHWQADSLLLSHQGSPSVQ